MGGFYFFLAKLARAAARARIPLLLLLAPLLLAGAVLVRMGAAAAGWARAGTPRVRLCVVGAEVVRTASCWACFSI